MRTFDAGYDWTITVARRVPKGAIQYSPDQVTTAVSLVRPGGIVTGCVLLRANVPARTKGFSRAVPKTVRARFEAFVSERAWLPPATACPSYGSGVDSRVHRALVLTAEKQVAAFPQYRDHFKGYVLGRMTRDVTTKMGVAAYAGETVLLAPELRHARLRTRVHAFRTIWSSRNGCDTSVRASDVEKIPPFVPDWRVSDFRTLQVAS